MKNKKGFTLVEVLLVIVIIAILAAIVIVAINPARQISQANNTQRKTDVKTVLDAVHEYIIDARGPLPSGITTQAQTIGSGSGNVDLCNILVPTYVAAMPFDPTVSGGHYTSCSDYNTGYTVATSTGGRITVNAPNAEFGEVISVTR